jgi:hypothetical protein
MLQLLWLATLLFSSAIAQTWTQVGADIIGEAESDQSGSAVSISADGNTVAIGANLNDGNGDRSGHVRVYRAIGGVWTQLGVDIDGEAEGDHSGYRVSLSSDGDTVAISGWFNSDTVFFGGHVRVYHFDSGAWTQVGADIDGEAPNDSSGASLSLSADGSIVAIGAWQNDGTGPLAGHVRVYSLVGTTWTKLGTDIDAEAAGDNLGYSVSLSDDGTIVAVGARHNDGNGDNAGHVRVLSFNGNAWTQVGPDIDGEDIGDRSGFDVSLSADGNTVAIGAYGNDENGDNSGHVRVYYLDAGMWTQLGGDINGEAPGDNSGWIVSLSADGNTVAISAYLNNGGAGHVRVYRLVNSAWKQLGPDIDGETSNEQSGYAMSLSADGNTVAIGAHGFFQTQFPEGLVRIFNFGTAFRVYRGCGGDSYLSS